MKKASSLLLLSVLPLWLLIVFCQSLMPAAVSDIWSGCVLRLLRALLPLPITMRMVRKGAHLLEFFVLGTLAAGVCRRYGGRCCICFLTAAAAGMTAGLCDETLQLFAAGRNGSVMDVWLDCLGSACGGGWICIIARRKKAETG